MAQPPSMLDRSNRKRPAGFPGLGVQWIGEKWSCKLRATEVGKSIACCQRHACTACNVRSSEGDEGEVAVSREQTRVRHRWSLHVSPDLATYQIR